MLSETVRFIDTWIKHLVLKITLFPGQNVWIQKEGHFVTKIHTLFWTKTHEAGR